MSKVSLKDYVRLIFREEFFVGLVELLDMPVCDLVSFREFVYCVLSM